MDPTLDRGPGRLAAGGLALAALGFIVVMAVTGAPRERQDRVRFEVAGIMAERPDQIDRVDLSADDRRLVLVHQGAGTWRLDGEAVPPAVAAHVATSLRFMHVTAPIRVLPRAEWDETQLEEFGLERPRYAVTIWRAGQPVVVARFGAVTPQQIAQYTRIEGRDELYLLPEFVGQEWERVLAGLTPQPGAARP